MANWLTRAADNIWDGITNAPNSAVNAYHGAVNATSSAIESTVNGASAAGNWIADTAAPAVSEFSATTLSVVASPIILASKITGIGDDSDIIKFAEERASNVGQAVANFSEYAADNPGRATALAAQGGINAVSTTVGLATDLGRSVVWDWTTRNVINLGTGLTNGLYNLGAEEGQEADWHIDSSNFLAASNYLNETLQVRNLYDKPEDSVWHEIDIEIEDENGKLIQNPNADYERVLLYGPQTIAEAFVFVAVGAPTMGAGSALYAAARTSSIATRLGSVINKVPIVGERITQAASNIGNKVNPSMTANQMKQADLVHDMEEVSEKVIKAEQKSEAIVKKAEDALEKAKDKLEDLEKPPESAVATGATTEQTANAANTAQTTEQTANAAQSTSTASAQQLEQARESVVLAEKQLEQAVIKGNAHVEKITDQAMRKTASLRRMDDLGKAGNKLDELTPGTAEYAKAEKEFDVLFREGFLKGVFKDSPDLAHIQNKMDDMVNAVQDAKTGIKTAEDALRQAKKTGTADEIIDAKQAVSEAKDNLKDVKITTRTSLDDAAGDVQELSRAEHIKESYNAGVYKGLHRWLNLRDHPIIEGTAVLGASALGVHIDQKSAEARQNNNAELREETQQKHTEGYDGASDFLKGLRDGNGDSNKESQEEDSKPASPTTAIKGDKGCITLHVKDCFNYLNKQATNDSDFDPTNSTAQTTSHGFNNRANDLTIALKEPLTFIKTADLEPALGQNSNMTA